MLKRPGNAGFPDCFFIPFIGRYKVALRMLNSESDASAYSYFNRPYPNVEDYEPELKPFIDAGCEVRFSRPQGSHVCEMRGCHRKLDISFTVVISSACRENPELMREFLHESWQNVKQHMEEKRARLNP